MITATAAVMGSGRDGIAGDHVSGTAAAHGVDRRVVLMEETVALEFLVKGEYCSFARVSHVACTTTATKVCRVRVVDGGWNGGGRGRESRGAQTVVVACTTAAGMVHAVGGVEGSGLSDDSHCCSFGCL